MPVADQLIDGAALHVVLSFMDGYSGYNQIFIAEEDIPKTAFRCPGCPLELLNEQFIKINLSGIFNIFYSSLPCQFPILGH